jgi:hypothetical protein
MRGGSSDRPSTVGEAGRVSKRRQESLEKHAGGTKLGARDADKEGKTRWGQAAGGVNAWGGGGRRGGREGGLKHCEGQAVGGGGWRGRAPEGTRMRGGSSDRPSTAGEAGRVNKRRQESLEKHAGGTKLGARDAGEDAQVWEKGFKHYC